MATYSGKVRDEDDFVMGNEWVTACGYDTTTDERRNYMRSNVRRIDMAANLNYRSAYEANEKDIEASDLDKTTRTREDSFFYGSDDSDGSDDGYSWKEACCVFSPCGGRILISAFIILLMFCFGLGVGLATKNRLNKQSVSAAKGAGGGAIVPPETANGSPTMKPTNAPDPTFAPTEDVNWDFDYESLFPDLEDARDIFADGGNGDDNQNGIDNAQDGGLSGSQATEWDTSSSPYLVGVYYYPWHGNNFHNGDGYIRQDLEPKHQPTLGEYDDSEPATIAQHIRWSRQANIGLWITSWWGPNRVEDSNTKNVIMTHPDLGDLKIALHYETTGRVGDDLASGLLRVRNDMEYICQNYFNHPNYYKIDGRPVIFVYVTRKLEMDGNLEATVLTMRSAASKCGQDVYLVGDHVFAEAPGPNEVFRPFWYFDAVTNYDVYGSMGRPSPYAGRAAVDNYYNDQSQWRTSAHANDCRYIPAVSPGYNDRAVRYEVDHPPLSRKLTENSAEGSLFAYQLSKAKPLVDPEVDNLLVVNSFNEWHEDTQIEPAIGGLTNLPFNLTQGVYYEGYGDLYLELLRRSTVE